MSFSDALMYGGDRAQWLRCICFQPIVQNQNEHRKTVNVVSAYDCPVHHPPSEAVVADLKAMAERLRDA